MKLTPPPRPLLAGLLLAAASLLGTQPASASQVAYSTLITFSVDMSTNIAAGTFNPASDNVSVHGTFDGWGGGVLLAQAGSSTVYTNTLNDNLDANGAVAQYKFVINGTNYESPLNGNNRGVTLPAAFGSSVVLPTAFFSDAGAPVTNQVFFQVDMSQQIALGTFNPATSTVEVHGSFTGWTAGLVLAHDPNAVETNQFGLTSTNVYDGYLPVGSSPGGMVQFKYVIEPAGNYESLGTSDTVNANRFFANAPQTLPLVFFSDAPYAPLAQVTFSVNMSAQFYYGNWAPSDGVFCAGINGDWNNDAVNTMTNNASAANTNIYYATYSLGQGSTSSYKFTYNGASGTVYESPSSTGGNNRTYTVPSQSSATVPTVLFNDLSVNDLLVSNVLVTFSVDMTGAVQYGTTTPFNPSTDNVYVNGSWLGWLSWDPISLGSYVLTNTQPANPNNLVYSGQFLVPQGNSLPLTYKYSINGADNEAGANNNHVRIIRSLPTGGYAFPTDKFGNQYVEPAFGELAAAPGAGGTVSLSWLGAPNVEVQTRSSLTGGAWTSMPGTSGASWSAGVNTTNGLVSVTNWPAVGSTYFRLIKQ